MASTTLSLTIQAFLTLVMTVCHEASPQAPQMYWNSMLPKTPIPSALNSFLNTGVKNPFYVDSRAIHPTFRITYAYAADLKPKVDPNTADFLLENDLHVGAKMDLHFYGTAAATGGFLPRAVSKSIPFSSEKLPELLQRFSVEPNSPTAGIMKNTLRACETAPALADEQKYCATSLESMVDFAISTLRTRDVVVTSTTSKNSGSLKQRYTITSPGAEELVGTKSVVCHPFGYPYAVFYCHMVQNTKVYTVPLAGEDGAKVQAMVICHEDTSSWNPKHISFLALHVKPGTVPVCHFLSEDNVVWTPAK